MSRAGRYSGKEADDFLRNGSLACAISSPRSKLHAQARPQLALGMYATTGNPGEMRVCFPRRRDAKQYSGKVPGWEHFSDCGAKVPGRERAQRKKERKGVDYIAVRLYIA